MFCIHCGKSNVEGAKFCVSCGKLINSDADSNMGRQDSGNSAGSGVAATISQRSSPTIVKKSSIINSQAMVASGIIAILAAIYYGISNMPYIIHYIFISRISTTMQFISVMIFGILAIAFRYSPKIKLLSIPVFMYFATIFAQTFDSTISLFRHSLQTEPSAGILTSLYGDRILPLLCMLVFIFTIIFFPKTKYISITLHTVSVFFQFAALWKWITNVPVINNGMNGSVVRILFFLSMIIALFALHAKGNSKIKSGRGPEYTQ